MKKYLTLENLGWFLTAILIFFVGQSIVGKLNGDMTENFKFMHLENFMTLTAFAELVGLGLLIYPKTSLFGAILLSCIMSGAVAMHLSLMGGAMVIMPIMMGVLSWSSHYLRTQKIS
jgi:hypothetical protein